MYKLRVLTWIKKLPTIFFVWLLLFPLTLHASFIESTIGTAVVNDATATYYNPAALILLKNTQIVTLGSFAISRSHFTGQAIQSTTHFTQSGSSNTLTHYFLPSFYLGLPITDKVTIGFAMISNFFNKEVGENSLLRYVQSSNDIRNVDFVSAIGAKLNDYFSLGAGINLSYANFLLEPTSGFPSLNIPDSQSRNQCDGTGWGGDIGFLLKPTHSTLIGFNYRSSITYRLSGKSVFEGNPEVTSNHYFFNFWTPARSVLSINHFFTSTIGMIATIQRIQWSIFKQVSIHGIANQIDSQPIILNATVPFHLRDAWLLTLGGQYRMTPKWIIRIAGSYNQSPGNNNYQISNGDSIILGVSMGYNINKKIIVDGSYAHAFFLNENIHVASGRSMINGLNKSNINSFSLKFTFNL